MKKIIFLLLASLLALQPIVVHATNPTSKKEPKQEEFLPAIAIGVAALLEAFTAGELALMGTTLVTAGYAGTHTEQTAKFVSSLGATTTTLKESFETSRKLAEEFSNGDGGKPDPGYRDDKWRRNAARAILCLKGLWVIDQILETYNLGNIKASASLSEIYQDYHGELLADLENWKFLFFSQNNGIAICKIADGVYLTTSRNGTFILTVSDEGTHVVPARGFPGLEKVSEIESFLLSNQQIKNVDERYEPIGPRSIQEILTSTEPFRPGEEQLLRNFLAQECETEECEELQAYVWHLLCPEFHDEQLDIEFSQWTNEQVEQSIQLPVYYISLSRLTKDYFGCAVASEKEKIRIAVDSAGIEVKSFSFGKKIVKGFTKTDLILVMEKLQELYPKKPKATKKGYLSVSSIATKYFSNSKAASKQKVINAAEAAGIEVKLLLFANITTEGFATESEADAVIEKIKELNIEATEIGNISVTKLAIDYFGYALAVTKEKVLRAAVTANVQVRKLKFVNRPVAEGFATEAEVEKVLEQLIKLYPKKKK